MERIDVLKLVRENQEKFKIHMQKMKELEEKEKQLIQENFYGKNIDNWNTKFKSYEKLETKNKLVTIPEREMDSSLVKKEFETKDEKNLQNEKCECDENKPNPYLRKFGSDNEQENFSDDYYEKYKNNLKEDSAGSHKSKSNDYEEICGQYSEEKENVRFSDDSFGKGNKEDSRSFEFKNEKSYVNSEYDDNSEEDIKQITNSKIIKNLNSPDTHQSNTTPKFLNNYHNFKTHSKINESKKNSSVKNNFKNNSAFTAYTFSTIKKIKVPQEQEISKVKLNLELKPKLFSKQYKGKIDRVALYQQRKNYWEKKPYLINVPLEKIKLPVDITLEV